MKVYNYKNANTITIHWHSGKSNFVISLLKVPKSWKEFFSESKNSSNLFCLQLIHGSKQFLSYITSIN